MEQDQSTTPLVEPKTYTVRQTSKALDISLNATYAAVRAGEIPSVRVGRRILIPRAALERWLASAGEASDD